MLAIKEKDREAIFSFIKQRYPLIIKTDTVWGLLSENQQTLFDIKRRPMNKPFVRLVANYETMHDLNDIHKKFLDHFWPGPITVIKNGIAYRMPNDNLLLDIINTFDKRIFYCTSANIHGGDIIQDIVDAKNIFNHWDENLVFVIPEKKQTFIKSIPSLIIDIDSWKILRTSPSEREVNLWIYQNIVIPYNQENQQKTRAIDNLDLDDNRSTWAYTTKNLYLVPEYPIEDWCEYFDSNQTPSNKKKRINKSSFINLFKRKKTLLKAKEK